MRRSLRFIPGGGEPLENRLTLSPVASPHTTSARGEIQIAVPPDSELHHPAQLTRARAIDREFARLQHHLGAATTRASGSGIPSQSDTPSAPAQARLMADRLTTAFASRPAPQVAIVRAQPSGPRATARRVLPPNLGRYHIAPDLASAKVQSPAIIGVMPPAPRSRQAPID